MSRQSSSRQARRSLDDRFAQIGPLDRFSTPRHGWVRTIRQALGMTAQDLGSRMGITRQSVLSLENSEIEGVTRIDTLRRAAAAMNCTFIYAFVPNHTLEDTVRAQASKVVDQYLRQAAQTMALEDQSVPLLPSARQDAVDDLVRTGNPWRTPTTP